MHLRTWKEDDLIPFSEMCANPLDMAYMPGLLTKEDTRRMIGRIVNHFDKNGFGLYAVEKKEDKGFIGFAGFMIPNFEQYFTPCIEIGWRIKNSEWNKGYATEAAKACIEFGFSELAFERVYSFTSKHNIASQRVIQKIGMHRLSNFNHPLLPSDHFLSEHVLYYL